MSKPEQNVIKYTEEGTVTVPSGEGEAKLGIRRADWERIKRLISNIPPETNVHQIVYTILFSIAGAIAISLIPIHSNPNLSPWVFPLYALFAFFSFIVAVIFCILDKTRRGTKTNHIETIQKDMGEIEDTFRTENTYKIEDTIVIGTVEPEAITKTTEAE